MSFEPSNNDQPKKRNALMPVYFAIVLSLGLTGGYFITQRTSSPIIASNYIQANGTKMNSLINYIEKHYVDTIDPGDLEEKAIASLLKNLDPHSDYIPAKEFELVNEPLEGNFDGIGVEFNIIKD